MARAILFPALLLSLAIAASGADAGVVAVYAITRHGARNVLPKNNLLKESALGPTLLPEGERMCYDAGVQCLLNPRGFCG
jgi:hypothetical protein